MNTFVSVRRLGGLALVAVLAFSGICTAVQFLRGDLDGVRVPLSFYLIGPHAAMVRGAYVVLAMGLVALGAGWHRALAPAARSATSWLLFTIAAASLVVTAFATTNTWAHPATLHGFIHGVAAQTAFLTVTVAMLLTSWRLRLDPRWRGLHRLAWGWAIACFVAMWVQALWHAGPRGLEQKLLILALLAWLAVMAWQLYHNGPEESPSSD